MQMHVFKLKEVDEINKCLAENVIIEGGVVVTEKENVVITVKDPGHGLSVKDQVLVMSKEIATIQGNILAGEAELSFFTGKLLEGKFSDEKIRIKMEQDQTELQIKVDNFKKQVGQYRHIIKLLESGELEI